MKKFLITLMLTIVSIIGYCQVQYVSSSTANSGGANTNTVSGIAYPSSLVAGNTMIMVCTDRTDFQTIATPAGWTLMGGSGSNINYGTQYFFSKKVTGSESGTFSITFPTTSTELKMVSLYQFSNVAFVDTNGSGLESSGVLTQGGFEITATGSMCVEFIYSKSSINIGTFSNSTVWSLAGQYYFGTQSWSEPVQEFKTTAGNGTTLGVNITTGQADTYSIAGGTLSVSSPSKHFFIYLPVKEVPHNIAGLRAWWKWTANYGLTSDRAKIYFWGDHSGNPNTLYSGAENTLYQATDSKRPAHDNNSGKVTGDGVDDFLQASTSINDNQGEVTAVVELPTSGYNGARALIGKDMHSPAVDGDALNFWIDGNRKIQKSIFVGNGQPMTSNEAVPTGQKVIVSWTSSKMFINGVECTYAQNYGGTWSGQAQNSMVRLFRGACASVGCNYYNNAGVYDVSIYNHVLTSTERTDLINYYKAKHNIP